MITWFNQQPFCLSKGAPIIRSNPVATPANPTVASTLTCTVGAILYGVSTAYQWLLSGVPISGATSSTFSAASSTVGDILSCQVTVTSITGATTIVTSNALTIGT